MGTDKNLKLTISNTQESKNSYPFGQTLGAVGFAAGVIYSFSKKTGFWKGWGIAIIGSITLGGIGYGIDSFNNNKTN